MRLTYIELPQSYHRVIETMNRQKPYVSLGVLIALAITLSMAILTLVLVTQGYRGMSSSLVSAADEAAKRLPVSINDRMKAITERPNGALRILSYDSLARAENLEERLIRLPVAAEVLQSSNIISAVYVGYPNGEFFLLRELESDELKDTFSAPGGTHMLLQTLTLGDDNRMSGEWFFYDNKLNQLERRATPGYDFDPRTRPWFEQARQSGETEVTEPYVFFTTGEIGITLARQAENGTAVVGIDATLEELSAQLSDLRLTPGTEIAIIDSKNTVVAYPHAEKLVVNTRKIDTKLAQLWELNRPALDFMAQQPELQESRRFNADGQDWFGVAAPLIGLQSDELRLLVAVPADELLADAWLVLKQQMTVAAIITLFLLALGWALGQRIGKPLDVLARQVSALARFNFRQHVGVHSRIREAHKLGNALSSMSNTIRGFQTLALTMNREPQLDTMLNNVVEQLLRIVGQRSGVIYLYDAHLQAMNRAASYPIADTVAFIDSVDAAAPDSTLRKRIKASVPGPSICSILRNRKGELVGTLIIKLESDTDRIGEDLSAFVEEVSGAAAVAIETRQLINAQKALLDGVIHLVADAIDAKSPYTSGHCERVPKLAKMLVDKAIEQEQGPFRDFAMSEAEAYEFHIAAWLHDCGKITSPEHVVDKATKLETIYNRIHEIRMRFEVLHRDADIRYLKACLQGKDADAADQARQAEQTKLTDDFEFIARTNIGGEFLSDDDILRIRNVADRTWVRHFNDRLGISRDEEERYRGSPESRLPAAEWLLDDRHNHLVPWGDRTPPVTRGDPRNRWGFDMVLPPVAYNFGEIHNLSIRRGTLTEEERFKINEHIVQTICLLEDLPLPMNLSRIPRLAGTHHERMDGAGYPRCLAGTELTVPEKAMVVADVFEALTAVDRPYKEGKTLSEALAILARMTREGHVDKETFELFVLSGVYRDYGKQFLKDNQLDEVDEHALIAEALAESAPNQ